jgi:hypothetical protein
MHKRSVTERRRLPHRHESVVKTLVKLMVMALSMGSLLWGSAAFAEDVPDQAVTILKFKTMVAVTGPYVGPANPIRDVPGGNLPWVISKGSGKLKTDGELKVRVRGLVIPSPPFNSTNPIPTFRAIVSCQSVDENGNATVANVSTEEFPATPEGNSDIETTISLPQPCIAPIVFVTHPTGRWFAVTGS